MAFEVSTRDDGISLRPLLPWLLLASALSVAMMVLGTGRGDRLLPALSAGLLAALVIGTGLGINAPLWSGAAAMRAGAVKSAYRCNVWLAALVYAWGASALLGMYSLSDLVWQHAYQYASGAALFSAGITYYAILLARTKREPIPRLAGSIAHGLAVAGGLIYLIASGKLATHKMDWAANEVFLWGGIAVVALCVISGLTERAARMASAPRVSE